MYSFLMQSVIFCRCSSH